MKRDGTLAVIGVPRRAQPRLRLSFSMLLYVYGIIYTYTNIICLYRLPHAVNHKSTYKCTVMHVVTIIILRRVLIIASGALKFHHHMLRRWELEL